MFTVKPMDLFNEPLFKALFDTGVPRVVLKADIPDFTIIAYNRAYELATHNTGRDITGMSLWEAYAPENAEAEGARVLAAALSRAVNNQEKVYLPPFRYNIPSAAPGKTELSWWELEIIYVPATAARPACLLTTTYNITERILNTSSIHEGLLREHQMAEELATMNEELSAANDELSSANERLSDTVEELHAKNEEMGMLNGELMHSQLDLRSLYAELEKRVERRTHALVESELQFKQLADAIIQIIWITDEKGTPEYVNQRWMDFAGIADLPVRDGSWSWIFHPDDFERAMEIWNRSLATGEPYEMEYRLKNYKGEYIWVLGRAAPFYDKDGKITKWFGTCTDINEIKNLNEKKDDFISIASHELKTPVTSLKASLQLLNKMKDNPAAKDIFPALVEQACRSSEKVSTLIENLLNVSKLSQGLLHLDKSRFNLYQLVEEICGHIPMAAAFSIVTLGETQLEVYADATRIEQVVVNFVSNAIKYAAGSAEIRILIEKLEDAVRLSVTDEGPGIPAEELPYLFDRYYRVDADAAQYSGLGLGLYINAEIIKKHGGKIGVNSEPDKGSTFWFTLPIQNYESQ
jgi:PAS domain S-box-containing protein